MEQNIEESNDADHRHRMILMKNLFIVELLAQIQAWAELLSTGTIWNTTQRCVMQRHPGKWESGLDIAACVGVK